MLTSISFKDSKASFLEINSQTLVAQDDTSPYTMVIKDCIIDENILESKDELIHIGEVTYPKFEVVFTNTSIQKNILSLGSAILLSANCRMKITACKI